MKTSAETPLTKQSRQCTECGGAIEAGVIFCGGCGKPVDSFPNCGGLTAANRPSCRMLDPAKGVCGQPGNSLQRTSKSEFRKSACLWAGTGVLLSILTGAIFQGVTGLSGDQERRSWQVLSDAWITHELSDIDVSISVPADWKVLWQKGAFSETSMVATDAAHLGFSAPDLTNVVLFAAYAADCDCDGDLFAYLTVSPSEGGVFSSVSPESVPLPHHEDGGFYVSGLTRVSFDVLKGSRNLAVSFVTNSNSPDRAREVFQKIVESFKPVHTWPPDNRSQAQGKVL